MAYKEILGLVLLCLLVFLNYPVNGRQIVKNEDEVQKVVIRDDHNSSGIKFSTLTSVNDPNYNVHGAYWYTKYRDYHGSRARLSLWGLPDVSNNAVSVVAIKLFNNNQMMAAGYHVDPRRYSDKKLHFFIAWSTDATKSSNINFERPGFVVSNETGAVIPGQYAQPLSSPGGTNYFSTLSIKKDETTGDWSLYLENFGKSILCGWWPKTLFTDLADKATTVSWGGHVAYLKTETGPPMGSGKFPDIYFDKTNSAYVSHIKMFNTAGNEEYPLETAVGFVNDREDCYKVGGFMNGWEHQRSEDEYFFFYGGPAGCKN